MKGEFSYGGTVAHSGPPKTIFELIIPFYATNILMLLIFQLTW